MHDACIHVCIYLTAAAYTYTVRTTYMQTVAKYNSMTKVKPSLTTPRTLGLSGSAYSLVALLESGPEFERVEDHRLIRKERLIVDGKWFLPRRDSICIVKDGDNVVPLEGGGRWYDKSGTCYGQDPRTIPRLENVLPLVYEAQPFYIFEHLGEVIAVGNEKHTMVEYCNLIDEGNV